MSALPFLLSDPFLQFPAGDSTKVVWFTQSKGSQHTVEWGPPLRYVKAISKSISGWSSIPKDISSIWRHEATINNIPSNQRFSYCIFSHDAANKKHQSKHFTLNASPPKKKPLKILLTSDHQCRQLIPMCLEQAQKIVEKFDAVFYAGDFANVAHNFNYWFTHSAGVLSSLQGNAQTSLYGQVCRGAEIIQSTPIFPALGNHDVEDRNLSWGIFNNIFSLPLKNKADPPYYAINFGNIRLVVLAVARVPRMGFSYISIAPGSEQYNWLVNELKGDDFRGADIRIVMLHHPIYSLNPEPYSLITLSKKEVLAKNRDNISDWKELSTFLPQYTLDNVLEPLFNQYRVDLVYNGHDHTWGHFCNAQGVHFFSSCLASLNYAKDRRNECRGLIGILPNIKPFKKNGSFVPYILGGGATFSILDTGNRTIESYFCCFEAGRPRTIKFDSFSL